MSSNKRTPSVQLEIRGRQTLRTMHYYNQNGICAYCGDLMNNARKRRDNKSVTLEHIIPQSEGGRDILEHTIAVCHECNQERDSYPLKLHHIVGILLAKGFEGLYPVSVNLYSYYRNLFVQRYVYKISPFMFFFS